MDDTITENTINTCKLNNAEESAVMSEIPIFAKIKNTAACRSKSVCIIHYLPMSLNQCKLYRGNDDH